MPADHRLVLALDRVRAATKRWDSDLPSLATGAAGSAKNPTISVREGLMPVENGASLCAETYWRAVRLSRTGDQAKITSYTCNHDDVSFRFTFNAKILSE